MIRAAYSGSCPIVAFDANDNPIDPFTPGLPASRRFCAIDQSGKQLERTPENAFVGNFQYTAPFLSSTFDWFWEGTATYQDKRFLDVDNATFLDEYWLFDTRIGLSGETFEFLIYVDNVFEDQTIRTGGSGPDFAKQVTELGFTAGLGVSHQFGLLPDPRTFGVRLTMRF